MIKLVWRRKPKRVRIDVLDDQGNEISAWLPYFENGTVALHNLTCPVDNLGYWLKTCYGIDLVRVKASFKIKIGQSDKQGK